MELKIDRDLLAVQEMRAAAQQAKEAQRIYMNYTQDQVDAITKAVADAAFSQSRRLALMAVEETGMGIVEHKTIKNEVGSKNVYNSIKDLKTVGIISEDKKQQIIEVASPFGIIAGIIPTTNPTSTAFFKTIISLKTRNAIVVSPHPYAVKCTQEALKVCEEAAISAGAPPGLISCLTMSSMEATEQLMKHPDVNLILATGGSGLVKAAYSSGKPAYGVGPGNVPTYIERTAKVENAVKNIINSKSFDNGTICATEQAVIIDRNVLEMAIRTFKLNGAYILNENEKRLIEKVISPVTGKVNPKIVGKSVQQIAQIAGLEIPQETPIIIGIETKVGKEIPFSLEKLSPILALYVADDIEHAKELCFSLLQLGGMGHSLSLHTEDSAVAKEFAIEMPVSRILVNTMATIGAVGGTTGLMPSMTLGCGSFGGNITSDNISAKHLLNIKRMAYGIKEVNLPQKLQKEPNNTETKEVIENLLENMNTKSINSEMVKDIVNQIVNELSK